MMRGVVLGSVWVLVLGTGLGWGQPFPPAGKPPLPPNVKPPTDPQALGLSAEGESIGQRILDLARDPHAAKALDLDDKTLRQLERLQQDLKKILSALRERVGGEAGEPDPKKFKLMAQKAIQNVDENVRKTLGTQKFTRAQQLIFQRMGTEALVKLPHVAQQLQLKAEQKQSLRDALIKLEKDYPKESVLAEEQFAKSGEQNSGTRRMEEYLKKRQEIANDVLTAGQKEKWKKMLGQPFTYASSEVEPSK